MKILFVCTGNTCRSPMAAGLMNKKAAELRLDIQCDSAGLGAFSGDSATAESIRAASEYGVDISSHRARVFNLYMVQEYDLIVAVTKSHYDALCDVTDSEKLMCFDIPDPYGLGDESYAECIKSLDEALDRLILSRTHIEKMAQEHIPFVAELERQCFSDPWSEDGLRAELTNENAHFYVYTCFGQVLGYMGMQTVLDECYIANVAVSPLHRRKGIGETLVSFCSDKAEEAGCAFISLEVRVSNTGATELYKKAGFEPVGERKNFYSHPTENGLIMTKELR